MHRPNVRVALSQSTREELRSAVAQSLSRAPTTTALKCTLNLTMEWQVLSSALLSASQSILGNLEKHQVSLDDNDTDIRSLIHDKNDANDALLRNPASRTLHPYYYIARDRLDWEQFVGVKACSDTELHRFY